MRVLRATLFFAAVLTLSGAAAAHERSQCEFEIEAELAVSPERIVIDDERLGEVLIDDAGDLFIDGREIELDAEQRESVEAFAAQLRTVVPAVVELAFDAAELALTAVTEVFAALVDGEPPEGVHEALADMRTDLESHVGHEGDVWYVRGDGIHDADDAMDSLGPAIERAMAESVGALLIAVGQSMSGGDGDFGERMEAFSARMERMGEEIEARVEADAEGIEAQAELVCEEIATLESRQAELNAEVPELARLRVLEHG